MTGHAIPLDEARAQRAEPLPLMPPLPQAAPFPIEALGPLAEAAKAMERKVQVPAAIAAQSVLAAASLAVQAHADVRLPFGQPRPLSLFLATVAESGARKSGADNEASRPMTQREKSLRVAHADATKRWAAASAAWQVERRKIEAEKDGDLDQRRDRLLHLGPEPAKPLAPVLMIDDLTPDGLIKNWSDMHAALGVFSAEGGVFTGSYGMAPEHKLRTAGIFSKLWDGTEIKRTRAGDGVSILSGRRLAMHVMIQPEAAAQFIADPVLRDQGLLSRFLVSAPASLAGSRPSRDPDPADEAEIRAYSAQILRILEAPPKVADGTRNELEPREIGLSPEAKKLWRAFADHVERQSGTDDIRSISGLAAKAAEHAARIAGVLTLYENLHAAEIDQAAMSNAIVIVGHYLHEAIRLHNAGRADPKLVSALRLLSWIQGRLERDIRFSEILQSGPNALRTKSAAEAAVAILLDHGWLAETSKRPRILRLTR